MLEVSSGHNKTSNVTYGRVGREPESPVIWKMWWRGKSLVVGAGGREGG